VKIYLIEIDHHCSIAHLRRLVVRVPHHGKSHFGASRTHRYPKSRPSGVRGGIWVAHDQAFPF